MIANKYLHLNLDGWCEFELEHLLPSLKVIALVSAKGLVALEPFLYSSEDWSSDAQAYTQQLAVLQQAAIQELNAEQTQFWQQAVNQALLTSPINLPLDLHGTDFQQEVWRALLAIPKGSQLTYAQLANKIQRPKAVRAVGTACGANPLPFLVPCHRVLGSNGGLGGFAFGLTMKKQLLAAERQQIES